MFQEIREEGSGGVERAGGRQRERCCHLPFEPYVSGFRVYREGDLFFCVLVLSIEVEGLRFGVRR